MTGSELRRECIARGMNRHTFGVYLTYSPIVRRVALGVYALRGTELDPALIEAARDRVAKTGPKSLQDFGWTGDKALWLGYLVTESVERSLVLGVPQAALNMIGGRKFSLLTVDGAEVGTLGVGEKGNAWGIGPYLKRRGVEVGDSLVIAIDTGLECALIQSGAEEILDEYQEGRGRGPAAVLEQLTNPEGLGDL
jgi:hypothetical protein